MKVGKEEAIGMLMAVELWVNRDHDAEWTQWTSWLEHIANRVSTINGITTTIVQPRGLSNRTPSLRVFWDRDRFGVSGDAVAQMLLDTDPRIALRAARGDGGTDQTGVSITPYMLSAGDERVVADRLHALLSNPVKASIAPPGPPAADLTGEWTMQINYAAGTSTHSLYLRQRGNHIEGAHRGDFVTRDLDGTIDGDTVRIRSAYGEEHGDALMFTFSGKVEGDEMAGTLDMGEYLGATWTAARRVASGE